MDVVVHPRVETAEWRQLDDFGASDPLSGELPRARIRGSWHHEGRDANRREDIADVEVHRRSERCQRRSRAEAAPHVPHEPVSECVVFGHLRRPLRREPLKVISGSPAGPYVSEPSAPLLGCVRPRVVIRTHTLDPRIEEH